MRSRSRLLATIVLLVLATSPALAAEPDKAAPSTADKELDAKVREEFRAGAKLIEESEWAAALAAFERSRALRDHPVTTYNIGVCQRFLGRYTLAERTLMQSLEKGPDEKNELPQMFRQQAEGYLAEIRKKLAHVTVKLTPPRAATAFDGRPLVPAGSGSELVAGVAPPGEAKSIGAASFVVIADPGAHVLTFQLEGHDTIEVRRDLKPGATEEISVSLTEQNAELQIDADRSRAVVRVDDVDVGLTPIAVTRPPGQHSVVVQKDGFVTYKTALTLRPGQRTRLAAELPVEKIPITKRWWFWTGAAAIVAGGVLVTYFVTRPDPEPPPYQTGTTGWLVPLP